MDLILNYFPKFLRNVKVVVLFPSQIVKLIFLKNSVSTGQGDMAKVQS